MLRMWLGMVVAAGLMAMVGCGNDEPETNYVEGTVTIDGKPLQRATVIFSPVEGGTGRPATGVTDDNGVYKLTDMQADTVGTGAAAGEYRVAINKVASSGAPQQDTSNYDGGQVASPTETVVMKSEIPTTYNRPDTSGLTATIKDGRNEGVNFELKSNP